MLTHALLLLAFAAGPGPRPTAELSYVRGPEAQSCPEEATLRTAVATRMGYDPFRSNAPVQARVEIQSTGGQLVARLRLRRAGAATAERVLAGDRDCGSLLHAVALALTLALDPLAALQPPVSPAEPRPSPPERVEAATPPVPDNRPQWVLLAELGLDAGSHPGGLLAIKAGPELRGRALSLALSGVLVLPGRARVLGGGVLDSLTVGGELDGCGRVSLFVGCLTARAAALRYQASELSAAQSGWAAAVGAGAKAGVEWPREGTLAGRLTAELLVPLVRPHLFVGTQDVWSPAAVQGGVSLGLRVRL